MKMKPKSLMAMAIAGTFGLSAAAYAGSSHEVITPFSVSDAGENVVVHKEGFSKSHYSAMGSTSYEPSGSLSGSYSDSGALASSDSTASIGADDSHTRADAGVYSDFYVVSFAPAMVETWDVYLIEVGEPGEMAAAGEWDFAVPTHELALISSDDGANWELALVPFEELSATEGAGD